MTADVGTFPRLQYLMPLGLVKELAFTGRRLYAEEAHLTGLVNKVFEDKEKMIKHAMEIAHEISRKTPLAVWGSKDMINYARGRTIREGLDRISLWQSGMYNPEADMKEAMSSNLEERDAEFEDLYPVKKDLGL
jgi:enoyl-CoA hydratase